MREFQEKKRFKKLLYSKVTVAVLVILILVTARATWGVYQKEQQSRANAYEAENQLSRLEDRRHLLVSEINRLNTSEGVEEEIRSQFGVAKPGEHVLILVNNTSSTTPPAETKPSLWQKFTNWFK